MKRHNFNLSHTHLTSFDMGELVPIMCREVLQGDIWDMSTQALVRMAPMVSPPFHPTHVTIHHWFVPHRIAWTDAGGANTGFEAFITGGPAGTSAPTHPTITLPNSGSGGVVVGSLANYFSVPLGYNDDNSGYTVSALPFRAYGLIWNQKYRDEDLQTELVVDLTDGPDTTTNTALQNVCWEEDYFTACRPSPQKGAEVTISLGTSATVKTNSTDLVSTGTNQPVRMRRTDTNALGTGMTGLNASGELWGTSTGLSGSTASMYPANLYADLTSATGIPITNLRLSNATQRFMEKMSRGGSRFYEWLQGFGIKYSDATLQIPQYLGGGKQTIQYSEVLQTAEGTNPVGTMAGHGIAGVGTNRFVRFFEEPGFIISLAYIKPKTMYTQGLNKMWLRSTKFDYWTPEMQFIGQQNVQNREVYAAHTSPTGTFGYIDRHEEYRTAESRVSGEFLSTQTSWHFARNFSSSPTLNGTFVSAVPVDTPFAVPSEDTCLITFQHRIRVKSFLTDNPNPKLL
jgi:hypothetical protein